MACNSKLGAPALIAPARAGAKVNFMWNPWFASHKGPLLSYMAPYSGPVEKVDFNQLHFFKISEEGLSADGKTWAVDTMMARGNVSSTMIPHDLKPGTYVLRHELIALHYATEDSLYHMKADKLLGPQVSPTIILTVRADSVSPFSITSNASTSLFQVPDPLNPRASYSQARTRHSAMNQVSTSTSGETYRLTQSLVLKYTFHKAQHRPLSPYPLSLSRPQLKIPQRTRNI